MWMEKLKIMLSLGFGSRGMDRPSGVDLTATVAALNATIDELNAYLGKGVGIGVGLGVGAGCECACYVDNALLKRQMKALRMQNEALLRLASMRDSSIGSRLVVPAASLAFLQPHRPHQHQLSSQFNQYPSDYNNDEDKHEHESVEVAEARVHLAAAQQQARQAAENKWNRVSECEDALARYSNTTLHHKGYRVAFLNEPYSALSSSASSEQIPIVQIDTRCTIYSCRDLVSLFCNAIPSLFDLERRYGPAWRSHASMPLYSSDISNFYTKTRRLVLAILKDVDLRTHSSQQKNEIEREAVLMEVCKRWDALGSVSRICHSTLPQILDLESILELDGHVDLDGRARLDGQTESDGNVENDRILDSGPKCANLTPKRKIVMKEGGPDKKKYRLTSPALDRLEKFVRWRLSGE
ncbi:hypothetical protein BC830DRAFT_809355 [Chytriomyces sp. MP71]|nr:hypothetical protein BC830DRAFT_809355 [Chytriomyces sp. MP71]